MFACVTSGLMTPGVRAASAWYGPREVEPAGLKYATASNSTAAATRSVRSDMLRRCGPRFAHASRPNGTPPTRGCLHQRLRFRGYTEGSRGAIAQLGERLHGMQEVAGSSPAGSIRRGGRAPAAVYAAFSPSA